MKHILVQLILLSFLCLCVSVTKVKAQDIITLHSKLDTIQSPDEKIDLILKIISHYTEENDLAKSLEYAAKLCQFNKVAGIYNIWWMLNRVNKNIITENTNLDSLKLIINAVDKNLITADFLNFIAKRVYNDFFSEYPVELGSKALKISKETRDTFQQAYSYYIIGKTNYSNSNLTEVIDNLQNSQALFCAINETKGAIHAKIDLSAGYLEMYENKKAEQELMEALEIAFEDKTDKNYISNLKKHLIYVKLQQGNYREALNIGQEIYNCAVEANSEYGIGHYSDALGMVLKSMGDYKEAIKFFKKGIDYDHKYQETTLARGYNHYADCFKYLGVYDSAAIYYLESISYAKKHKNKTWLRLGLIELSLLYYDIQDTISAKNYAQRADDYLKNGALNSYESWDKWQYLQFENANQIDSTIYYLTKELKIVVAKNAIDYIVENRILLADLYLKLGRLEQADQQLKKAWQLIEGKAFYNEESNILQKFAKLFYQKGNLDQALKHAVHSAEIAEKYGIGKSIEDIYQLLLDIHVKKKDYKEAFLYQSTLDSLKNSRYGFVKRDLIAKYEAKYRLKEKELANEELVLEKRRLELEKEKQSSLLRQRSIWLIFLLLLIIIIIISASLYNKKSKLEAQNKLRKQITRDIHDDVGGIVNNLIRIAKEDLEGIDSHLQKNKSNQIVSLGKQVLFSLKDLIWKTEEEVKAFYEVDQKIRALTSNMLGLPKLPYKLTIEGFDQEEELAPQVHIHLLMFYKEVLQNVIKHGADESVKIYWSYRDKTIQMEVKNYFLPSKDKLSDDGNTHRGLVNMRERVKIIGGSVEIKKEENLFSVWFKTKKVV